MSSPGSRAVGPPPDPGLLSLYDTALPEVYGHLLVRACTAFRRAYESTGGAR